MRRLTRGARALRRIGIGDPLDASGNDEVRAGDDEEPAEQQSPRGDLAQDEPGLLYRDHIHFDYGLASESRGYRLMARRMAEQIGQSWGLKPRN